MTRQPRVLRREVARPRRLVDEHEVHRLLGDARRADRRSQPDREREDDEQQHFDAEHVLPVAADPLTEIVSVDIRECRRDDAQHHQDEDDPADGVWDDVDAVQKPEQVRKKQQSEGLRQGIAAVRQPPKHDQAERQHRDRDDLEHEPPANGLIHSATRLFAVLGLSGRDEAVTSSSGTARRRIRPRRTV